MDSANRRELTVSAAGILAVPAAPVESRSDLRRHLMLNEQQSLAVLHGTHSTADCGPLLVIAGAGSGKTNTLACRVAHLVQTGTDPRRILLLTFTRRAAAEMVRRAGQVLQRAAASRSAPQTPQRAAGTTHVARQPELPWAGTFHSIGARLLREFAAQVGLRASFTIHDRGDSEDLLAMVRHDLGLDETRHRFPMPSTCLAIYSRAVNGSTPLAEVLKADFPWCARWDAELHRLFDAYVAAKQAQNVLDYDDLLLYWAQMVGDPGLAGEIGGRFDQVLVDEYQDTNRLQAAILLAIKPDGRGLTVVGDDAQAIYSFRAATVRNILEFPERFSPPARIVTLDCNYRSTQPILDACNAVIGLAAERFTKNLWSVRASCERPRLVVVRDEADQAGYVAEQVLGHRENGAVLRAQAVLFRSATHSAQLEIELAQRGIPFVKYGGLRFLEAAHVKDVLAILRWAENPRGRLAGFRAARLVPGIGAATAARLLDAMDADAHPRAVLQAFVPPPAAAADWQAFAALLAALDASGSSWPADMERVARWYEPQLHRLYDDAQMRLQDIVQLQQIAATYPSRERFLTEMTLDPPAATGDEAGVPGRDDDYLVLSTIHSAKGQEWKAVYVLNVVDGCIPSDMATGSCDSVEEERRLLYVAMTRARDHLHLIVPQRFYTSAQPAHGDRHVYAASSRFIPDALHHLFERCAWPAASAADEATHAAHEAAPAIDIPAGVRALWR